MMKEKNMLKKNSEIFKCRVAISEFLGWLRNEKDVTLCMNSRKETGWSPLYVQILNEDNSLLDEFFGIDPIQLEKERRELLEDFVERVKR